MSATEKYFKTAYFSVTGDAYSLWHLNVSLGHYLGGKDFDLKTLLAK